MVMKNGNPNILMNVDCSKCSCCCKVGEVLEMTDQLLDTASYELMAINVKGFNHGKLRLQPLFISELTSFQSPANFAQCNSSSFLPFGVVFQTNLRLKFYSTVFPPVRCLVRHAFFDFFKLGRTNLNDQ